MTADERRATPARAWDLSRALAGRLDGECLGQLAYRLFLAGEQENADAVIAALAAGGEGAGQAAAECRAQRESVLSAAGYLYPGLVSRPGPEDQADPPWPLGHDDRERVLTAAGRLLRDGGRGRYAVPLVTAALLALIGEDQLDQAASWCAALDTGPEEEEEGGDLLLGPALTAMRAAIELRRGNLRAAEDLAGAALTALPGKAWGIAIGAPLSTLLQAAVARRGYQDAARYLRLPTPQAMPATLFGLLYQYARGAYYLATGSATAALADLRAVGDQLITWGLDHPGLIPWRAKAAEAHLVLGDTRTARDLSAEQLANAGPGHSRSRAIALRVHALTHPPDQRIPLLRESAALLRRAGAPLELAATLGELSGAHRALDQHDHAARTARQAAAQEDRCGVSPRDDSLSVHRPGEHNQTPLSQLSNAERRVAKLAAHGCTNQQIAGRLLITVSTVEQHLTRVYRKLGLTTRTDLPPET